MRRNLLLILSSALLLATTGCGIVRPASGPPTYGDPKGSQSA